ncbi:MAG: hypothetical protein U0236_04555 [Nitrospira sp.]
MVTGLHRFASFLAVMFMWAVLPGCSGGDGGSDPTTVSQPPGSPPSTPGAPSPSPPVGGNLPPMTGSFGGGQGKILFAEGINLPTSISELDLATRRVRVLVDYSQDSFNRVVGGVSRANDGTFAVVRDPGETEDPVILHYRADGVLLHKWLVERIDNLFGVPVNLPRPAPTEGGALSPDGKSIAYVGISRDRTRAEVVIRNVQDGPWVIKDLPDAPPNKTTMHTSTLWSPAGELYVISEVGLHKVDRTTGGGTLLHSVPLFRPHAPVFSSDGRTIYFDQLSGNPRGGTVWSMDVVTGETTRRSMRLPYGEQYSPALSPDGQWLLMQEANLIGSVFAPAPIFTPNPVIGSISVPLNISAIRSSEVPIDTQNLNIWIVDAAGQSHLANGRMVWF